jgi:hypothetical protein
MLIKVACKNGFSLYKHVKIDRALIFDKNRNVVFRGSIYNANQKYLKLTSEKK